MRRIRTAYGGTTHQNLIAKILIVIEGLPLFAYPFVMIANVMQLAAYPYWDGDLLSIAPVIFFMVLMTVYPISYFICLWLVFGRKGRHKLWIALIPLIHILPVLILFVVV